MWRRYQVTWHFTTKLCGSVPLNPELVRAWIEARAPEKKPEKGPSFDEIEQEVMDSIDAGSDRMELITLGFQRDERGLWLRSATIRAHIKDCATQVREYLAATVKSQKIKNYKNFKSIAANRIYVEPYRVYITRNGEIVQTHDGQFDQAVHVMTALGPRSALKTIRYVEQPTITFDLLVLDDGVITEDMIRVLFDYGAVHGYGGERSMGEGRYRWEMKLKE